MLCIYKTYSKIFQSNTEYILNNQFRLFYIYKNKDGTFQSYKIAVAVPLYHLMRLICKDDNKNKSNRRPYASRFYSESINRKLSIETLKYKDNNSPIILINLFNL